MGVYSHGPMISFNDGFFLASWKNGVLSEDQPGQRVLWRWATEAAPLKYSAPAVLFPNMSTGEPCVAGGHPPFPKNHSLYPPNPSYGPLNYRTAARTLFLRPYLAHFCPVFSRFFAVFSVLTPGFQKVAPKDRGAVP